MKRRYINKSRNEEWQDRTGRNRSHVLKNNGNQGRGRLWQADRNTETATHAGGRTEIKGSEKERKK